MQAFTQLESIAAPLPRANVDTDQIIPARYLKGTSRAGLGEGLFAGWRQTADGSRDPDFVLHDPRFRDARILLAGDNFGCGSSREHAVWALAEHGFRAVISTRFADIFRQNALGNGLLPITVEPSVHTQLFEASTSEEPQALTVDLSAQELRWPGGTTGFEIDSFAKHCMLRGLDRFGYLLEQLPEIERFEAAYPLHIDTRLALAADDSTLYPTTPSTPSAQES